MKIRGLAIFSVVAALSSCEQSATNNSETEEIEVRDIDPSKLVPGPIRHGSLTPEMEQRIRAMQSVFAEFDPTPPEKWIEDFKRDMNPESELRIWEAMAVSYQAFLESGTRSEEERNDAYNLLLVRTGSSTEETLKRVAPQVLPMEEARGLLNSYRLEARPIRVSKEP